MSILTRIKNNQITDSTILANTKIVPGSIVGSLFNANLTMTSDVTITGNLTVQGSSTYLTVASTNTYVNDPLIVMNNAFAGTNTNDIGLLFNRGSDTNQAFIWDESEDEFRLIATSETGTTYGNVTTSSYANVRVGNLNVQGAAAFGSLSTTGDIGAVNLTLSGDAAVNGGDITTTAATFNLVNTDATTVNLAGAATSLVVGAATGTVNLRNANIYLPNATTVYSGQTNVALLNENVTTLDFAGAATALTVGANTGTLTLRNATVTTPGQIISTRAGSATTGDGQIFLNGATSNRIDWAAAGTGAPAFTTRTAGTKVVLYPALSGSTVDYAIGIDAATMWSSIPENTSSFNFKWYGAETLVANLSGTGNFTTVGDVAVNGGDLTTTAATFNLVNTDATTVNFAGAAATLIVGATTGVANIRNSTTNIIGNATVGGTLDVTGNIEFTSDAQSTTSADGALIVSGGVGIAKNLNVGGDVVVTGNLTVNGDVTTVNTATLDVEDLNITVAKGAASAAAANGAGLTVDGASATLLYANSDDSWNVNKLFKGTAASFSSTLGVTGETTLTANLAVNGGDLTTTATTASVFNTNATTVDAFKAATNLELGATTGFMLINNPIVDGSQATQDLFASSATQTLNLATKANTITIGATTGTTNIRNALVDIDGNATVGGTLGVTGAVTFTDDLAVNGGDITTTATTTTVFNTNATTVNAFGAATVLNFASASSNTTIRGNLISNAALISLAGISTIAPTSNPADGTTSFFVSGGSVLRGNVFITEEANISYANIYDTRISTSSSTGALVVTGGVGLGSNLNVSGGAVINIDQTAEPFQVKGQFATTLIYADSVTDTVTIGGSNTNPVSGATLRVNGTGAMILPVGSTGQRPGTSGNVDVIGMLRLNNSLNILEYYDGSAWQSSQGSFTVINSESFSGDGVEDAFTMLGVSTTASTIVSINGIVQIPTTSYSITGNLLTFTEAPEVGDAIDVRRLSTTATVDELGFAQNIFKANASYAYISTGTSTSTQRFLVDTNGLVTITGDLEIYGNLTVNGDTNGQINIGDSNTDNVAITAEINSNLVPNANNTYDLGSPTQRWRNVYSYATIHDETATNVSANATPTLVDTFITSSYSSAKYLVQIKDGSIVQAAELLLVQDTANAYITTYGVLSSNVELGTFTANVASGNVNLYYTSTSATNSNVKVHTTYIV
jgi:fibronectin-binding autotransporter adhesin